MKLIKCFLFILFTRISSDALYWVRFMFCLHIKDNRIHYTNKILFFQIFWPGNHWKGIVKMHSWRNKMVPFKQTNVLSLPYPCVCVVRKLYNLNNLKFYFIVKKRIRFILHVLFCWVEIFLIILLSYFNVWLLTFVYKKTDLLTYLTIIPSISWFTITGIRIILVSTRSSVHTWATLTFIDI